ncbi:DUF481 domain-containing protein [Luteimonas lutimaris]|uniref:DUF481 domain-containing protein n=1 Tax=Luteimonas lutimaris TaxID=698645 RepID=A0ABP7MM31_9GAMM|nr:DUF481 domain-containing protein [Luteimonas sp.]
MPAVWWLALAGLPVFQHPLPESPGEPAALAVAAEHVSLRAPCYRLVCPDAEWLAPSHYTTLWQPDVPGARRSLRPLRTSPLATRSYASLHAPTLQREWFDAEANNAKVDTTFGMQAVQRPDTKVQVELGTGYRLQPYADYGTAAIGVIASGGLHLTQRFGERARLDQRVHVETGRHNTYVRQTLGVDILLQPRLTLQSRLEVNHDSAGDGGRGSTDTQGSVNLHYAF